VFCGRRVAYDHEGAVVKIGSFRDPGTSNLFKASLLVVPLALVLIFITFELTWLALLPLAAGALAALLIHARGGAAHSPSGETPVLHPGYNISRVKMGGFPGAVLVVGFVWIFVSGLPGVHLVVIPMTVVGVCVGVLLALRNRTRTAASPSSLGLIQHDRSSPSDGQHNHGS
jgi:hypothetical protein